MLTRRFLSFGVASFATLLTTTAFAQPVADTITQITHTEDTSLDWLSTIDQSALLSNDPKVVRVGEVCNNPNQCATLGTQAQKDNAVCNANVCEYPDAITTCAIDGANIPVSCTVNNVNNTLDIEAESPGADDYADDFNLTYTVSSGTAGISAGASGTAVSIAPVTDLPTVTIGDSGFPCMGPAADICLFEDQPSGLALVLPLDVTTALGETSTPDPFETIYRVDLRDVPVGVNVVCGGDLICTMGSCTTEVCNWDVQRPGGANFVVGDVDISLAFPRHYATFTGGPNPIDLDIRARADDRTATVALGPWSPLTIQITERADAPTVTPAAPVGGGSNLVIGTEDQNIPLGFAGALVDVDGSESLIVQISNMPLNASLTAGTNQGGGTWDLTPGELAVAEFFWFDDPMDFSVPDHLDTNATLTLTARAVEIYSNANGLPNSTAVTTRTVEIQTNAVADTPSLTINDAAPSGDEHATIALDIEGELVDTDGSEALFFYITVPVGGSLTHGIDLDAGEPGAHVWQVSNADIGNVGFVASEHLHGTFNLNVRAGAMEMRGTCDAGMGVPPADAGLECPAVSCSIACNRDIAYTGFQAITVTVNAVADAPNLSASLASVSVDEANVAGVATGLASGLVDIDGSESCTLTLNWTGTALSEQTGNFTFSAGSAGAMMNTWELNDCDLANGLEIFAPTNGHGTFNVCATAESTENIAPIATATASVGPVCFDVVVNNTNLVCGDDFIDSSEQCDDGADNENAPNKCRTSCLVPTCGDDIEDDASYGTLMLNEECDQGAANSDTQPNTCRTDCRDPFCGDSVKDMFEACDDGNNGIQTDNCLDGCLAASCGDNFVWAGVEECDTGLDRSDTRPNACRTSCLNAFCTDGVLDTGEACDDGNQSDQDGCPTTCELATCGDGFTFAGMEQCDQGANNSNVQPNTCRTSCNLPSCGDLVVDSGEDCDDGNGVNEDACVNTCDLNVCGDGFVDLNSEECDDGQNNSNSQPDACRPGCLNPSCGDGVVDAGESCDLGAANDDNTTNPNGCKTNCALPGCGDGIVGPGEQCDNGAANSDTLEDACRTTCTLARCGDGVLDTPETCDDGPANNNTIPNACRRNCQPSGCGDGVIDVGETCDDGAANSNTLPGACRTTCTVPSCGDMVVDPGESCDDGPNNSDTASGACRTTCVRASCGDGVTDPGEACDEGTANGGANCDTDCTLPAACGDGAIDPGEECDDGALNSDTAANSCRTDCSNPFCGDGVVDSGEECDAGATPSDTCDSECVVIDEPAEDMGMGEEDMGTPVEEDMGPTMNNGTADAGTDMGGEGNDEDMGTDEPGPGVTPADDEGCCRTIRRSESDSGAAAWLAMLALGFAFWRRRR